MTESLLSSDTPQGREWVDGELIRIMMGAAQNAQYLAALMVPVVIVVGWRDVPLVWLLLWALGAWGLWFARVHVSAVYLRTAAGGGTAVQRAFVERYGLVWPLNALWWGLMTALFFDRTPLENQFTCWLIVCGTVALAINNYSAWLPVMRSYIGTLMATSSAVVFITMASNGFSGPAYHWWMLALILVCWHMTLRAGQRVHRAQRRTVELLHRNSILIESLKRQTHAALDAVAVKNRFLASATHDIRQPVHALALYADWLRNEPALVDEIAPKIVQATAAVNALFDSLFDFAKLDSGRMRVQIETLDVRELMRELETQYRPLAAARGLQLRTHEVEGSVVSDPIRLRRILGNLLSNAIKYTERGGVLLAARRTARGVRFEVWDTGIGIAPMHQKRIFSEFYKVPGHAGTEDGFGLGLAIVARVAASMGHPIAMKSRPGRGSMFSVTVEGAQEDEVRARISQVLASGQMASRP
ncbi:MAG: HAMP domain-containing histidine kinase [Burkholderiaceae bacterium]|nr:HAMP domain-containing histidine kinase [Burkholderiaceae bacterium]